MGGVYCSPGQLFVSCQVGTSRPWRNVTKTASNTTRPNRSRRLDSQNGRVPFFLAPLETTLVLRKKWYFRSTSPENSGHLQRGYFLRDGTGMAVPAREYYEGVLRIPGQWFHRKHLSISRGRRARTCVSDAGSVDDHLAAAFLHVEVKEVRALGQSSRIFQNRKHEDSFHPSHNMTVEAQAQRRE